MAEPVRPVRVRFYGHVRDVVGEPAVDMQVSDGGTVGGLLDSLVQRFGEPLRQRLLTSQGELEPNVQVFVGDSQVRSLAESLVSQGEGGEAGGDVRVFVLSACAGGSGKGDWSPAVAEGSFRPQAARLVSPAKAGVQREPEAWVPASAGTTGRRVRE